MRTRTRIRASETRSTAAGVDGTGRFDPNAPASAPEAKRSRPLGVARGPLPIFTRTSFLVIKSALLATISVFSLVVKAEAETLTMACKFQSRTPVGAASLGSSFGSSFDRIDQIVIDFDKPSFQLRVANTMGTDKEEAYTYEGLDNVNCLKPQIQKQKNQPENIVGSQQCGGAIAFSYFKPLHQLIVSNTFIGGVDIYMWDCR